PSTGLDRVLQCRRLALMTVSRPGTGHRGQVAERGTQGREQATAVPPDTVTTTGLPTGTRRSKRDVLPVNHGRLCHGCGSRGVSTADTAVAQPRGRRVPAPASAACYAAPAKSARRFLRSG